MVGVGVGVGVGLLLPALRRAFGTTALLVLVDGDGLAVPEGVADGAALPVALGDADAGEVGVGTPAPASSTGRNRSWAVCCTVARMFWSCLPGIEMTMLLLAVVTSDSATPKLSTRLRMMETAWSSASFVTFAPFSARGVRMTLVPPSRSRPSRGEYLSPRLSLSLPIESGATTQISA